jgi:hypothetical protein
MTRVASRVLLGLALWVAVLAFVLPGVDGGRAAATDAAGSAWASASSPFVGVDAAATTPSTGSTPATVVTTTSGTAAGVVAPVVTSQPRRDVIYTAYLLVLVGASAVVLWAAWGGRRRSVVDLSGATA